MLRRAVYAFNGMKGSEENPAFAEEMAAAVGSKDARVLVMCDSGGTYEPTPQFMRGKKSRSWQVGVRLSSTRFYSTLWQVLVHRCTGGGARRAGGWEPHG